MAIPPAISQSALKEWERQLQYYNPGTTPKTGPARLMLQAKLRKQLSSNVKVVLEPIDDVYKSLLTNSAINRIEYPDSPVGVVSADHGNIISDKDTQQISESDESEPQIGTLNLTNKTDASIVMSENSKMVGAIPIPMFQFVIDSLQLNADADVLNNNNNN